MLIDHLFEAENPRVVVTYPGRFQPFHQGHHAVFQILQKQFGADNVYILTSDKTDSKKSPFNFQDKVQLMAAAGVPIDHIIETSNMYSLPEEFDATKTIFIAAVGAPDADRLKPDSTTAKDNTDKFGNFKPAGSPSYYKTWTGQNTVTANQHGYVIIIPEIEKTITLNGKVYDVSHGTECRNLWNQIRNDKKLRHAFLTQLYGKVTSNIEKIFDKIPYTLPKNEDLSPIGQSTISPISGNIQEEAAGVGVVANIKQRKNPKYSTSLTKDVKPGAIQHSLRGFRLAEETESTENEFITQLRNMLEIAMQQLKLTKIPPIKLHKHITPHHGQATFGRYLNDENVIHLALAGRHPVDILRTLAHELVHYKQNLENKLNQKSGETGSPEENEAHAIGGIIMRNFNKKFPESINAKPLM